MAITVAFDGTRLSEAESETDGGTWDEWDTGKSPSQEPDFVYQFGASSASISLKVGTSETGVEFEATTAVDYATTPRVMLFKVIATNYAALNTIGATGMVLYIGSGTTTDRYNYYVHGADTYPIAGGWVFVPIDPNVTAYRDATDGTPALGSVDYYAISCTFTASSKSENVAMDAVDYFDSGTGLTLTGNTPDGVFEDFVDEDEGTAANRWAIVRTVEGIIYVLGTLAIGTSGAATSFTDSNRVLVFPDSLTDVGFAGLAPNIENASSDITWSDCVFVGRGKSNKKIWFDTTTEMETTNDTITAVAHGFLDGQAVLYSKEGGSASTNITDATEYWIEVIDVDTISLHTTRQNAMTAATPLNLTPAGGEQHSLRRQPDTRPTLTLTGTSGTFNATGCIFDSFRLLTLTSAATLSACKFVNCSALTQSTATLDLCTITTPFLTENESFITSTDLSDITNSTFTEGDDGHAIELTVSGVHSLTGNTFTDYWTHGGAGGDGATFNTTGGVDGGTDIITTLFTHGFSTGDAVYYNDGGGTATPIAGAGDGGRYYVRSITTTTLSLHATKEDADSNVNLIALTSAGGEIHALYSTKAAILNSSGGQVTVNVTDGSNVYVRNATNNDTAIVNVSVSLELNGLTEGTRGSMIGDGGAEDGNELLSGYADSTGKITGSFGGSTPQAVIVRARNGGIIAAAVLEDNGTGFTDFTAEARDTSPTPGIGSANDIDLLPATPALNDAFHFAGLAQFEEISIDVDTAGDTYVLTWEYWNGAWTALTVVDGTSSFFTAGVNTITFTAPGDWATTSVNSQGPFYYVRARVTTGGGTQPRAQSITLSETTKYVPFDSTGTIQSGTGLTSTAVWVEDVNNP